MLYQYKESTNIDLLVDTSSQIRTLTLELSTKSKLIDQLKDQLKKLVGSKPADLKRDEDLAGYLASIIKDKDTEIQQKDVELKQLVKRDSDMKEMLHKYELLSKATNSVGVKAENTVDQMTADFRRSGLEHNAVEDETSRYIRLMREEKEQKQRNEVYRSNQNLGVTNPSARGVSQQSY